MKMTLNLTFEDGMKVVEAMKKVAIENGWDAEELDECSIIEEYSSVIDAVLAAMGIEVSIDGEPKVEDENKYCDSAADCYFCNSDDEEDNDRKEEVDAFGLPMDYWSEFDEDNGEDDSCRYSLTAKGEFVVRYMEAGHTFEEACKVADLLFGEGE
jgi:hypothetical protein